MPAFQTLGELGGWLSENPNVTVVDAGIPLSEYAGSSSDFGPAWKAQPSVRKVVGFVARNIASIPLHVYERVSDNDRRRVRTGPLAELVSRPSSAPGETASRFFERLLIDGLLNDRWCALKRVTPDGRLELVRIPARRVRFKADGLDRITKIRLYDGNGQWIDQDPDDFVIDVGYAERGGNGTSPLVTLRHLLQEQREAVEYRRAIWKRGARIPGVIERPNPWPADGKARESFRRSWAAFEAGGGREGGTPLLEDGMTYKELHGFKPVDTDDLEGRRLSDIEVASAYHIPPELVGARQGNFSNIQAFRQMLFSVALGPYISPFEEALNHALVPLLSEGRDLYIEANVEAKMRGSFEEQAAVISTATGAPWMSRNEARAKHNLSAIDGGDDLVTPLNVLIGGQASPRDSAPPPKTTRPKQRGVRVKVAVPDPYRETVENTFREFFRRQRSTVLSALGSKAGEAWWDEERWNRELADDLYGIALTVSTLIGQAAASELGFDADDYDVDRTTAFLRAVVDARAKWVNEATRAQILEALAAADDDDARTPADVFDDAENQRSLAAGAALAATLGGFASVEVAKQLVGATATKTWVTTSTSPRAAHAAMNGQTVSIEEAFSNGAAWPGDPVLGADGVAGCMCSVQINY